MTRQSTTRRSVLGAILAVMLVFGAVASFAGPVAAGDGATFVLFDPDEADVEPGDVLTIDVWMSDHGDLHGNGVGEFSITVGYDSDVLTVEDVEHEGWLDDASATVDASTTVEAEDGTITIAERRDPPGDGVRGSGTVATLTFAVDEGAGPTTTEIVVEESTVLLVTDWPQGVVEGTATIYVDGGTPESADADGDEGPAGVTLGEPDEPGGEDSSDADDADSGDGVADEGEPSERGAAVEEESTESIPGPGIGAALAAIGILVAVAIGRFERAR